MARFARVIFLLLCLHAGVSDAQTYVRPSDGSPVTLFTNLDYNTAPGVTTYSTIINLSGFEGLAFTMVTSNNNCSNLPTVEVAESPSGSFAKVRAAPAVNASYVSRLQNSTGSFFDYWLVAPLFGYVRIGITPVANDLKVGVGNTCTVSLVATPLAFANNIPGGSARSATATIPAVGDPAGPTKIQSNGTFTNLRLQNVNTTDVFCGSFHGAGAQTVDATSTFGFIVKAASGANKGDGGVIDLPGFASNLYCVVAAGSGNVSVLLW